jgi:FG-GAP repeat
MKIMKSPAGSPANERPISITLTILSLLLGLAMLGLWLPASTTSGPLPVSTTGGPLPALQGEVALNHLKEQGLYGSLQEAVAAARYGFYQEPKRSGDWRANNPAQRLSARLTPDGLQVVTGGDGGRSHRLGIRLRSAGYGERQMAAKAGRLTAGGARAEIHYELPQSAIPESQSAIIEWYHNTAAGLEHGFTIESAPGERRDGEMLRVALALEGELRAEAGPGGQALEFRDDAGRRALRYDHLVVRDGAGRELEARMAAPEDGGEVWLEVDDREAVWPVTIDPTFTQRQKLEASDAAANDEFGSSVAISGETVVVSAPGDDGAPGDNQGSAYVFVRSGGVWTQQQKLLASDATAGALFGFSVAISGETVVVGAVGENNPRGAAYVFVRSGGVWTQQQKLLASDAAAVFFGLSVAISGETVVVCPVGSAHVFARSGGVWSQQQKLLPSDGSPNDRFGDSVAISGETVVVGARNGFLGLGSAYVFVRSGGVWSQQQKLVASDAGRESGFGDSVAISGETVVVGSPLVGGFMGAAYVFARSGGVWSQQQKLLALDARTFDNFGSSVAISGETVVVGSPLDDGATGGSQGSVYVFSRSGGVWSQQQELVASDAAVGDFFGISVAISGETVVVGAPFDDGAAGINQGSAYVFGPVPFNFSGFFPPVDNPPAVNVVNAGRAIPVKFSLSGDKGLDIFAAGFPVSQQIACSDGAPASEIEETVTAGGSSLSYDAESDTYTYVWKTEDSWAGTCRQLIVRLNDGSERVAFFKFK